MGRSILNLGTNGHINKKSWEHKTPIPRNDSNPHLKRFTAYMESNESKENVELRADEGAIVVKEILEKQEIVFEDTNNNDEAPEVSEAEAPKSEPVEEVSKEVVEQTEDKPVEEKVEVEQTEDKPADVEAPKVEVAEPEVKVEAVEEVKEEVVEAEAPKSEP